MMHAESIYNGCAVEYVNARIGKPDTGLAAQFASMKKAD